MTENFELNELQAEIDVCGQRFCLKIGDETVQICCEILDEAKRRLKLIKLGKKDKSVSEPEICMFFKESIERLLGKGTVDKTFGERVQNIESLADLLCFVASEIRKVYESQACKLKQSSK